MVGKSYSIDLLATMPGSTYLMRQNGRIPSVLEVLALNQKSIECV